VYERLLVALDGSAHAERVLDHAEALASAFGSVVTLVRATISAEMVIAETSPNDAGVGSLGPTVDPTELLDADRATATEYLERAAARLTQRNIRVEVEEPEGPADEAIVERATALRVSLILMTTHGRGGLGRLVFGSVADSVLRHAPCPVLIVRVTESDDASESPSP
jgi:nucleotide-binding universal stress UspA family protein